MSLPIKKPVASPSHCRKQLRSNALRHWWRSVIKSPRPWSKLVPPIITNAREPCQLHSASPPKTAKLVEADSKHVLEAKSPLHPHFAATAERALGKIFWGTLLAVLDFWLSYTFNGHGLRFDILSIPWACS